MYNKIQIHKLLSLENAINACFGDMLDEHLPQVESEDDVMVDALQESGWLTRNEARCRLSAGTRHFMQ